VLPPVPVEVARPVVVAGEGAEEAQVVPEAGVANERNAPPPYLFRLLALALSLKLVVTALLLSFTSVLHAPACKTRPP
jgi:hypothetical protein